MEEIVTERGEKAVSSGRSERDIGDRGGGTGRERGDRGPGRRL